MELIDLQSDPITLFENGDLLAVARVMETWQPAKIASFFQANELYQGKMKQPEFASLWQTKRDNLRLSASPEFHFVSQPGLDDMELVLGYIFYLLALKNKEQKEEAKYALYLKNAMIHYSIHAHQTCLQEIIATATPVKEEKLQPIADLLSHWSAFAKRQGTPGYLLLASGYLQFAQLAANAGLTEQTKSAYYFVWKYLHLAKLTEAYSEEAIHNAYFGKGMVLANGFELTSIEAMFSGCLSKAKNMLDNADTYKAEQEAKRDFSALSLTGGSPKWSLTLAEAQQDDPAPESSNGLGLL